MSRVFSVFALVLLAACSGGGGPETPPQTANQAPTANAGPDIIAGEADLLELDGAGSSDGDGDIASYAWRQISGPAASFRRRNTAIAQLQAPLVADTASLTFELRIVDDAGAAATDRVDVEIRPAARPSRLAYQFEFGGKDRTYTVYTPPGYTAGAPAVMLLHGGGTSMRTVLSPNTSAGRWVDLSRQTGFLLIAPNGFNPTSQSGLGDRQTWNDLRTDTRLSQEDDAGFLLDVLSQLSRAREYDAERVFVTGASNGGIMSQTMIVLHPETFAGAAAFISSLPQEDIPDTPASPPVFLLNGDADPLIPFEGGEVGDGGAPVRSVEQTVSYWLTQTGADSRPVTERTLPDRVREDDCRIVETLYATAQGGQAMAYYEARGGGHSIPDPTPRPGPPGIDLGPQCRDAHGVDLALSFFEAVWTD